MTVILRPEVDRAIKACRTDLATTAARVGAVQQSFEEDVTVLETRSSTPDVEFIDAIRDVYGVLDLIKVAKKAGVYTNIPGPSERPEQVVAGIIAMFSATVRIGTETRFHVETATNRAAATKTCHGRVCLFAAESFSSTVRHRGYRAVYEGSPFDVYEKLLAWFYHGV